MKKKFQIFISLPNSLRTTSKRILKCWFLTFENFFSAISKNFSIGHMKNPRSFLISNRGQRTRFHFEFLDLEAGRRNSLRISPRSESYYQSFAEVHCIGIVNKWYHEVRWGGGTFWNSWKFMIFHDIFFWPKKLVFYVFDFKKISQYSYLHKRLQSHRQTHVNFGTNAS